MDTDPILWQILLQLVLIGLNAVFACAEIAVISMNDNKLAKLVSQGDKRAIRLARLTSQPARFLATIQVAITLSGFLGSAFAAENFSDMLVDAILSTGAVIPVETLDTIAVVVITLILSYLTLVFGELVPKRIAMKKAEQLALGMSALISGISAVFFPLVSLLTASTNGMLRLLGIDPNAEDGEVTEEEIRMMVDVGSEKGAIDIEEKTIIQNVFEFNDITVGEIATHRTEVSLLWADESIEEWEQTIIRSRCTLYPICKESVDDVVGILNIKEYFRLQDKSIQSVMASAVKPPYFVPESLRADILFRNMQTTHTHFAVVLDEYGGVSGIITMNDLLEQLVGELEDDKENCDDEPEIERIDSNTWKISGTAELDEIEKELGIKLESDHYETLNGLVFGTYGHIPDDGEQIEVETDSLLIKVIEIKEHRVEKAIVCLTRGE